MTCVTCAVTWTVESGPYCWMCAQPGVNKMGPIIANPHTYEHPDGDDR
jgi:hypothetical protein